MIKVRVSYFDDKEDKVIEIDEDVAKSIIALDNLDGAIGELNGWLWDEAMDYLTQLKEEIGLEHNDTIEVVDNG